MQKTIVIENQMTEISKVATFIELIGEELDLSFGLVTNLNLALEEAIANVIMYAYPSIEKHEITLTATCQDNLLVFVLTDSGTPFDPTSAASPDLTIPIEERPIGGLGIMLIRKIMDKVSYQYINEHNQLTLGKYLNK